MVREAKQSSASVIALDRLSSAAETVVIDAFRPVTILPMTATEGTRCVSVPASASACVASSTSGNWMP